MIVDGKFDRPLQPNLFRDSMTTPASDVSAAQAENTPLVKLINRIDALEAKINKIENELYNVQREPIPLLDRNSTISEISKRLNYLISLYNKNFLR
jgi:hypothetical protein